jgi:hypothetical protein
MWYLLRALLALTLLVNLSLLKEGGGGDHEPQLLDYHDPAEIVKTEDYRRTKEGGLRTRSDLALFLEGLLAGIVHAEFHDLESCVGDVYIIQTDVQIAIADFRQETFESMRQGLKSIAAVIREMPVLTKDCKDVPEDLAQLLRMADIIEHPLALMYRVAKNFLVNGVDIFKKFNLGMQAYTAHNYFDCGRFWGEAFDEVARKSPATKKLRDEQAYDFLCGYMDGLLHAPLERVNIYNRMDQMGPVIMGPVMKTCTQVKMQHQSQPNLMGVGDGIWMGLMEFKHSFID